MTIDRADAVSNGRAELLPRSRKVSPGPDSRLPAIGAKLIAIGYVTATEGRSLSGPVIGAGDNMATLMPVDLVSDLVDLTEIPLDELWNLQTPALGDAIRRTYERAAITAGTEIQDQRG